LTPVQPLKPRQIRALRLREGASQAVFARYLNVTFGLRMPARVFRPGYGRFQFLEFDQFSNAGFWSLLQRLLNASQDASVNLMVVDPDPEQYFHQGFGHFGMVEFPRSISREAR